MKMYLPFFRFRGRNHSEQDKRFRLNRSFFNLMIGTLFLFLFAGTSSISAQDDCDINKGWWDDKYLELNSGIEDGDTVHWNSCQVPWDISATDLKYYDDLKYRYCGNSIRVVRPRRNGFYGYYGPCVKLKTFCYMVDLPEDAPQGMYQLWKYEYIVEDVYCHRKYKIVYYLALYDHGAPIYQCFPNNSIIASVADMPPVDEKVKIIDFCQYVAWWDVETIAVVDTMSGDTIGFVRRWSAGDPSGNTSYKDQYFWVVPSDGGGSGLKLPGFVNNNYINESDWKVYPNPSKSVVYIDIKSDEQLQYSIYDAIGRSVKKGAYHQGNSISLDNLKAGVYHLQLYNREQILGAKKLVLME